MSDDNLQRQRPAPPSSSGSLPSDPYGAPGAPGATNIPRKSFVVKTTKPRPHVCTTCTRSFARLEHLKRHERSHTKEKPFQCPVCERCFARRDLLLRHQQKLHASYPSGRTKGVRKQSASASGGSRPSSIEASTRPSSAAASRVSFDVRRRVSQPTTNSSSTTTTGAPVSANSTPSPASSSTSSSAVNNPVLKRSSAMRLSANRRPRAASFSAQTASSYTSIKDAADIRQQLSSLIPLGPSIVDFSTPQLGPTVYMSDIADDVSSLSPNDSTSLSPLFINPALLDSSSFASGATPGTPYTAVNGSGSGAPQHSTPLSLATESQRLATFFPQSQGFSSLSSIPESNNNNNNNNSSTIPEHLFNSDLDDFSSLFSGVDAQYMNFGIDNSGQQPQQQQHHHHHHHQSDNQHSDDQAQNSTAGSGINFNHDLFKTDYETFPNSSQEHMLPPPGAIFGPVGNEFSVPAPVQQLTTPKSGGEISHRNSYGGYDPSSNNNNNSRYNTATTGQPVTPPLSLSPQTTDSFISITRDGAAIPTPPITTSSQLHSNSNVNPFDRNPAPFSSFNTQQDRQHHNHNNHPHHNQTSSDLFKNLHNGWSESLFSDNGLLNFDSNHLPQHSQHSVFNLISDDLHVTGLKVTPQIRLHLLASLATPTPFTTISKPQLPSTIELQRFLNAYSRDFDRHLPFIPPTYVFDEENAPLLLAMAAIGALYENEPAIARNIFETSRRSIHVYLEGRRLRQNVERQTATQTLDPLSKAGNKEKEIGDGEKVDPTPVWLIQCLILGVIYGLFCGDPVTAEIAVAQTSAVVSLSRSAMLHLPPTNRPQLDQSIKSQWECFVECQTHIRTFHAVHIVSSLLAVDFNIEPALKIEDIGCGSPCDEFLWNARTPEEWSPLFAEYQAQGSTEMAIYGLDIRSVLTSLMECDSVDDLHIFPIPGFTIVSLMYAIHHYIYSMQSSKEWNSQVMRGKIETALQGWQAIWSLSPYASVMPSTQYGPMMSDAIWNLNFAKLRLAIDYSRVKELFWSRDFVAMGHAVSELNSADLPWAAFVAAEGVSLFDKQCGQADAKSMNRQNFIQLTFLLFDSSLILCEYIRRLEVKIGYESENGVVSDNHNLRDLSSTFEGSNDGFVYKNRHILMRLKDDERALYVGCRDLVLRLLGNLSSSSAMRSQVTAAAAAATAAADKVKNESESISPSEQSVIDIYLQLSNLSLSNSKKGVENNNNNNNNEGVKLEGDDTSGGQPATLSRLLLQTVAVALESSIVWPITPVMAQALRLRCDQLSQPAK